MAHVEAQMRSCIENCQSCHQICVETLTHCLQMGGEHADADHLRTLMDCAQMCATSADFMSRGSTWHTETCGVCADICEQCAMSCDALEGAEMKRCADECRRCAEDCRRMSSSAS
jgi:hypothetical protein